MEGALSYNWDRAPTVWERHGRRMIAVVLVTVVGAALLWGAI